MMVSESLKRAKKAGLVEKNSVEKRLFTRFKVKRRTKVREKRTDNPPDGVNKNYFLQVVVEKRKYFKMKKRAKIVV